MCMHRGRRMCTFVYASAVAVAAVAVYGGCNRREGSVLRLFLGNTRGLWHANCVYHTCVMLHMIGGSTRWCVSLCFSEFLLDIECLRLVISKLM